MEGIVSCDVENIGNKVIVIGGEHYNTLGAIRSLGEKGLKVYLIIFANGKSYVSKSKYVVQSWKVKQDEKEIMNILVNEFLDENNKPIIIPTSDNAVEILDANLNILKSKYIVPNSELLQGKLTYLMNKKVMNTFASASGLLVPESWEVSLVGENAMELEDIIYPCIVKPLSSIDGRKEDIVICHSELELKEKLNFMQQFYNKVLIQEYVDGNDSKMLEIIGCVTYNNKEIVIPGVIEKIREYPLKAGSTSYAKVTKISKYIDLNKITLFLNKLGFVGVFDLEFKFSNGKLYFIEINFRNGAPGYVITKTGVNVLYLWYLEAAGVNTSLMERKIGQEIKFMSETRDFKHVFNKDLGLLQWLKDLIDTRSFLFINLRDIKPLIFKIFKL